MVDAQEWLEQNYPKENRREVQWIWLNEPDLEGELDLRDFTYWGGYDGNRVKVYISPQVDENKLIIKNLPKKAEIIPAIAQRYIDYHYPTKEKREKIKKLDIGSKELEGRLNLSDFINLKSLDCSENKLTFLDLSNCSRLEEIRCYGNQLTSLDTSKCSHLSEFFCSRNLLNNITLPTNLTNLKKLDLNSNYFLEQNLSFLIPYTNLESLCVGNSDKLKISQGIYNRFTGSLDALSGMEKLEFLDISNTDLSEMNISELPKNLEKFEYSTKEKPDCKLTEIISQLDAWTWKDLHANFVNEHGKLFKKEWEKQGFNKEQTKEWMQAGVELNFYGEIDTNLINFISYLNSVKKTTPKEFLNNKDSEDYRELKSKIEKYNWCRKCQQINVSKDWCQFCAEREWQKDIRNLTGQEVIEKFIRQHPINKYWRKLEWISYEQFANVEYLTAGGFSEICKAKWKKEEGEDSKEIILKILNDSQNVSLSFLKEIANAKLVDGSAVGIARCYGISQDPNTKNYLIVMRYIEGGNLRNYLKKNVDKLSWENKLEKLFHIAWGLKDIHEQGLVHRDFHSGNILNEENYGSYGSYITDLGLSGPAHSWKVSGKIFGVLPYVAPEVLQNQPYTQASDVYSFGIIAYEILTGLLPYVVYDKESFNYKEIPHDLDLVLKICQGLRPNFNIKIPQLLEELIRNCWDADPVKRPRAEELKTTLSDWYLGTGKNSFFSSQFIQQLQEVQKYNQELPEEIRCPRYKTHSRTTYTSKLINTKQIAQLFQESEEQALELEIKKIEQEINQQLTDELKELVSDFIQAVKKMEKKDKSARGRVKELKKELEKKEITKEKVEKIILYCERFVESENELEKERQELQAQVEINTVNK